MAEHSTGEMPGVARDDSQRVAQFVAASFVALGAGYGVATLLASLVAGGGLGLFGGISVTLSVTVGPLVALVLGLLAVRDVDDPGTATVGAGVGSFVGFVGMVVLLVLVVSVAGALSPGPGGTGGVDILGFLVYAVGVAVSGALGAAVSGRLR